VAVLGAEECRVTPRVAAPLRDATGETLHERAFRNYLRMPLRVEGTTELEWTDLEWMADDERQVLEEQRVLSKGASGGGFLVPTSTSDQVIAAARAAGALSQAAQEFVTAGGETFNVPMAGTHGTAAWTAESGSYTASDETITNAALSAFKSTSKIIVSEELLRDSAVDLDAYLVGELGGRIGVLNETGFINGNATVTAATGSTTNFTPADVAALFKALPLAYRSGATWIMNGDLYANLSTRTDSAGGLVFPSLGFDPPSLLGRPVLLSADLASPAASAKSIAIGNWKLAYGIRRVNAVGILRQQELHSDTGQLGMRAFHRVDGRPLLTDAARLGAHSAT
jgi:HK97 family phage major capsid protein